MAGSGLTPDRISTIASHRGIGIHDRSEPGADPGREGRNRPCRSDVGRSGVGRLCRGPAQPPEARLFAANKVEVEYQVAAEERRNLPIIHLQMLCARASPA